MLLFRDHSQNLLPADGEVYYFGPVLDLQLANDYLQVLLHDIAWQHDEAYLFGKHYITDRKVAWYGDEPYTYTYSNKTKRALAWTPELLQLKQHAEQHTGATYNSCLLNLYHNGNEGMAWHSDGEKALKRHAPIASFSLGAVRRFAFKHKKTGEKVSLFLEHGSLLLMTGTTQDHWLHRLPPSTRIRLARVNLTFRSIAMAQP
jgi:alkylated DNA repair dioxygenase AlkB